MDGVSEFSQYVFSSLPRADQRRWAEVYLRGLMCVEGKKSIRRIAESFVPYPAVQSLQQFLNQSPWDWRPVCRALRDYVARETSPSALSVGVVHIPKRGSHSVGVRRRFVKEADRSINSQIGVGLFLTAERSSIPVGWRIVLDDRWGSDPALRRKVSVPPGYRIESEWQAILDALGEYAESGEPIPLLADLRGVQGLPALLPGLSNRAQEFLIEVDGGLEVREYGGGPGPGRSGGADPGPVRLRELCVPRGHRSRRRYPVLLLAADGGRWRPAMTALVRLADSPGPVRTYRVITQPSEKPGRERYWITNMLDQKRWGEMMRLIPLHARHRAELEEFRTTFGVADFEGRSFVGWQHHMTISSAAFAGSRLVCRKGAPPGADRASWRSGERRPELADGLYGGT
nr:transposase [Streptomyces hoynatensis]